MNILIIDDDYIKKVTHLSAFDICNKLKQLFNLTCRQVNNDSWNSYDHMNDFIISKIHEKWS